MARWEIDPAAVERLRREGGAGGILDVREPWELKICAVAGSLDIPMAQVPSRVDALPRDGMLVVMCHHGARSLRVTEWLRANGFDNAINLAGGIDAWAAQIDDTMTRY
ncbi:MAG: sulfurtransferase [Inquilinus sp.]|nr:sulfurtransferase [Inquilinus sp.]